ncbi:MAG: ATPase [Verrucomicrobia bacterium]|nr:ATPase [Cytophagales bacterium]
MDKYKYTAEFELKASNRMLFPYIATPSGLAEWFADDVKIDPDKTYNFIWDDSPHYARLTAQRPNKSVRFDFLNENQEIMEDAPYIEFKIDLNEMTQSSFLRITDYSDTGNDEDLHSLWQNLVANLREIVGG